MNRTVTVIAPGLLTTVQDRGRWGWQDKGVPVAGPMDPWSFRLANALVGNAEGAAALEITAVGPLLRFSHRTRLVLAGGEFECTLNGRSIEAHRPHESPAGGELQIGRARAGARAYLACGGGLETVPVFGSRATHVSTGLGGVDGRPLRSGDVLMLGEGAGRPRRCRVESWPAPRSQSAHVRVLPGPHVDVLTAASVDAFTSARFTVSTASDRMGYRLEGPPLSCETRADIISEAVSMGTIQIPRDGRLIVLMADRQTTGGYPKLGTVIAADIGLLGQVLPGASVSFSWCDRREAVAALLTRERAFV